MAGRQLSPPPQVACGGKWGQEKAHRPKAKDSKAAVRVVTVTDCDRDRRRQRGMRDDRQTFRTV